MIEVGQIIVAIGPRLYEVLKGKDCAKCAFQSEVREPCWCYCADFYSVTGGAHFKELDAVRSHNVLKFLEAQSQQERGKILRVSASLRETKPTTEGGSKCG